jgi:hypothetical protein
MLRWGILLALCAVACGSADTKDVFGSKICVAGVTVECACPGGVKGAQACRDDGTGYEACQCGGSSGSGGSAGAGQAGTGGASGSGAGGSCTGRTTCPAPEADGGAQLCGMLDDYCGGAISCGCEFASCNGGACDCGRAPQYDDPCSKRYMRPLAMSCLAATAIPAECHRAIGPLNGVDGPGFPSNTFCCAH